MSPQKPADDLPSFVDIVNSNRNDGGLEYLHFNHILDKVNNDENIGRVFIDGNYALPQNLKEAVTLAGKEILGYAAKYSINLSKTREFKDVDLSKNAAEEIGALMLAASMETGSTDYHDVLSNFDNVLTPSEIRSITPDEKAQKGEKNRADVIKEIAKQILGDNFQSLGYKDTIKTDPQFVQSVKTKIPHYSK